MVNMRTIDRLGSLSVEEQLALLSYLSDSGFRTSNPNTLGVVAALVSSSNKYLAQVSSIFLVTCGGALGTSLLLEELKKEVPHKDLLESLLRITGVNHEEVNYTEG